MKKRRPPENPNLRYLHPLWRPEPGDVLLWRHVVTWDGGRPPEDTSVLGHVVRTRRNRAGVLSVSLLPWNPHELEDGAQPTGLLQPTPTNPVPLPGWYGPGAAWLLSGWEWPDPDVLRRQAGRLQWLADLIDRRIEWEP